MTDPRQLSAQWRVEAEAKEAAAKGYNRKCTTIKGMQCLLEARVLRRNADQLDKVYEAGEARAEGQAASADATAAVAENHVEPEAVDGSQSADAELTDQAP